MSQDNAQTQDGAPNERVASDGSTAFAQSRLIADADLLLGVGPNIVAGALHGVDTPYLSVAEAKSLVQDFLTRPVGGEEG